MQVCNKMPLTELLDDECNYSIGISIAEASFQHNKYKYYYTYVLVPHNIVYAF